MTRERNIKELAQDFLYQYNWLIEKSMLVDHGSMIPITFRHADKTKIFATQLKQLLEKILENETNA